MVFASAPLRLSLAGGGSDIETYSNKFEGAVVSVTLARHVYTKITSTSSKDALFTSVDLDTKASVARVEDLKTNQNLPLHTMAYSYFIEKFGVKFLPINVSTYSDCPVGAGLGASSSLAVSLITAFSEFFAVSMTKREIADAAYIVERNLCKMEGGKQDQYAAAFGGLNFFHFLKNGLVDVTELSLNPSMKALIESSFILYDMGRSRVSSEIIRAQKTSISRADTNVLSALHAIKDQAFTMKEAVCQNDLLSMAKVMEINWLNKQKTSTKIVNDEIFQILDGLQSHGALASKVSGAGGGGFILVVAPMERRMKITSYLSSFGGEVANCMLSETGSQAWSFEV